ncbi:MAG: glycosyltransferase [Burkholderiaceae bacterium]|nr:glycosyltransferase [Burkholderiaceae bacterium]
MKQLGTTAESVRKRLLFVSPRFLFPADCGGKIRTRDILRGLKGGRFEVTLAAPAAPDAQGQFASELARVCDRFVSWPESPRDMRWKLKRWLALLSSYPVAVASDGSGLGRSVLAAELARGYDVLVADFPHAMILLPADIPCPSVLFTHNVEAEIFRRHAAVARNGLYRAVWHAETLKMRRFEHAAARAVDSLVAVSERDGSHFEQICGSERVTVIPTGVDLEYFTFDDHEPVVPADGGTVVFTGSMDWLANVDGVGYFMDEIWPLIARERPQSRMIVVGRSPPKALVQAARERGLAWTFTGFVDDVRPYVRDAHVYVIPLRVGGGTRIKAYEAMAMGRSVVSTSIGVEGLPVTPEREFIRADTAASFANAVLRLLDDSDARRRLATDARTLIERNFSARVAASIFEEACTRAIERASAPGRALAPA